MTQMLIYLVTYPADKGPEKFARSLVERRLVACINLVKVSSKYWWEGRVQDDEEYLLIIKTSVEKAKQLEEAISREHPYQVPEIISLRPDSVSKPYLEWLIKELST